MNTTFIIVALLLAAGVQAQKANFIDNDWEKARAEAKKQGKYLFVDAYTDWCYWCKVMDKQTFAKDEVAAFMNKNFVSLKLDMEKAYGPAVAMKYRINSYPSYIIFNPEGKLVYSIGGFMEAKPFIEKLENSLKSETQATYPGISDKVDLEFPDFYKKAYAGNGKRQFPDSVQLLTYLNQQKDLYSEVNYNVMAQFAGELPAKYQQFLLSNRDKYASLYSEDGVNDIINTLASRRLSEAIGDTSEAKLANALTFLDTYMKEAKERESTKLFYNIRFYRMTGNWKKFGAYVDEYISINGHMPDAAINEWGWAVYEHADDKALVEKAISWMKPVIENTPKYYSMDTYASLLYKAGNMKEAETYAAKAIEIGKQAGEKTKETEELLEKIKGK